MKNQKIFDCKSRKGQMQSRKSGKYLTANAKNTKSGQAKRGKCMTVNRKTSNAVNKTPENA